MDVYALDTVLARRLLVFVAILMGLTALAAGLAAPPRTVPRGGVEEPILGTPVKPASPAVEQTLELREPHTIAVNEGDELRLTVQGDVLDSVELVGLGLIEPVAPDTPAVFDVLADRPGSYPIRLVDSGEHVGRLRVTPGQE